MVSLPSTELIGHHQIANLHFNLNHVRVVDKSLGVGWGEETLFLFPRRSRRSTPISTPPTNSPPNQLPKPTNHPTNQTMSNPTIPAHATKGRRLSS
ncbi:hypothetical protein PGT21_025742 [Puccinia graminis f. sp. tritici]|uniref:Uncharacterized protein n=1 Tax=Puccinia graminis f. sp. tritici TaxID=56615 RepID=A0A5B0Q6N8_PUCGR|nr:hypothetical protein PGT21_025742 [Puccinia graminis f. sp. tritici]